MKKLLMLFVCLIGIVMSSSAQYKTGELFDKDGLKGVIIRVDESGQHGLIMSLEDFSGKWLKSSDDKFSTNCFDEEDGEKNLAAVEKYIKDNNTSWDMFPFFQWCRTLGPGWYPPALEELKAVVITINGHEGKGNAKAIDKFNKIMKKQYKGTSLVTFGMLKGMYSSTEGEAGYVYMLRYVKNVIGNGGKYVVDPMYKKGMPNMGSRAVHKF